MQGSSPSWDPPAHIGLWAPELDAKWHAANPSEKQLVRAGCVADFANITHPITVIKRFYVRFVASTGSVCGEKTSPSDACTISSRSIPRYVHFNSGDSATRIAPNF